MCDQYSGEYSGLWEIPRARSLCSSPLGLPPCESRLLCFSWTFSSISSVQGFSSLCHSLGSLSTQWDVTMVNLMASVLQLSEATVLCCLMTWKLLCHVFCLSFFLFSCFSWQSKAGIYKSTLARCRKVKVAESCLTLCEPHGLCSSQGSSVRGILQARILEWVAISFFRGIFLIQGLNMHLLCLLHWQASSLPLAPHRKPRCRNHLLIF